ncbi:MAG: hypothetical protein U1B78_08255 [Dehalococcoidia bacterium]|nr:hypothetical protein [Dehalococcoidia bacterium]
MSLEDWRDVIIIAAGSLTILVLLAAFIFTVLIGLGTRALISTIRRVLTEEVTPLLSSVRQTVNTVRGTVTFVSETAVKPVIRVYSVVAGTRRAMAVLAGLTGRRDKED